MNVPIILADDLGDGDLGIYGNPDLKPPHIDRLARDGVRLSLIEAKRRAQERTQWTR